MEAAGYKVTDFMFVAQEKTYPYASKVFRMTKEQMDFGWSIMEKLPRGLIKNTRRVSL